MTIKKYRNPICLMLVLCFLSVFSINLSGQIKEQLLHNNIIPEHFVSGLGADVHLSVYSYHRSQWTGLSSSPKTTGMGANLRINPNLIAQVYFNLDNIQFVDNQNFKVGVVYAIGKENRFKFGLRAGVNSISQTQDFNSIDPVDQDPVLSNIGDNEIGFDVDFSLGYSYQGRIFGLGVNNLLESGFSENGIQFSRLLTLYAQNTFNVNFLGIRKLMMYGVYRSEFQSLNSGVVELNSLVYVSPKFGLGAGYRFKESVPVMAQYRGVIARTPIQIQYSYEIQTGVLSSYNTGSHEISIRVTLKNRKVIDPELDPGERERKSKNVRFL